jgi:methyl-accepting chemotaxis protein
LPSAQLRIVGVFGVLAILYAALNVFISKRALDGLSNDALDLDLSPLVRHDLQVLAHQHAAALDLQLCLFTFLSFCMVCLAGILLSHRLGGPIYHLKKYLMDLAAGTIPPRPVRFRRKDFFHDLADAFNRFQRQRGLLKEPASPPPSSAPPATP